MLCKGPSAVALNSSYSNRDSAHFKQDLCASVRAVAAATRGGVLVFFPSHASMKGITDEWRRSGGYRELEAVKSVFTEPRTAQEFQQVRIASRSCTRGTFCVLNPASNTICACLSPLQLPCTCTGLWVDVFWHIYLVPMHAGD